MPYETIHSPVATTQEYLATQQLLWQLEARLALLDQQLGSIDKNAPDAPDAERSSLQSPSSSYMNRFGNPTDQTSLNNNAFFSRSYQTLEGRSNTSSEAKQESCCDDNCVDGCSDLIMSTTGCCEIMSACVDCIGVIGSCLS